MIDAYRLDKHSMVVKFLSGIKLLSNMLNSDPGRFNGMAKKAEEARIPIDDFVADYCEENCLNDEQKEPLAISMMTAIYLTDWCKYQQSYIMSASMFQDFNLDVYDGVLKDIKLPFPTIFVLLQNKKEVLLGLLIHQHENGDFSISAMSRHGLVYYYLNKDILDQITHQKLRDQNQAKTSLMALYVAELLSVYRQDRKALKANKVLRKGKVERKGLNPIEWRLEDSTIIERTPTPEGNLKDAFNLEGLIPPNERKEEVIVEAEHTHASPRRHHVKTHTCVYWTGKGRKIPVVRTIQSYERGGKKTDHARGARRICKSDDELK